MWWCCLLLNIFTLFLAYSQVSGLTKSYLCANPIGFRYAEPLGPAVWRGLCYTLLSCHISLIICVRREWRRVKGFKSYSAGELSLF